MIYLDAAPVQERLLLYRFLSIFLALKIII